MHCWIELNSANLRHNYRTLSSVSKPALMIPVIKSNAYGHGMPEVARTAVDAGADWLCVNSLEEAVALRQVAPDAPILVMGYIALDALPAVVEHELRPVVYRLETLEQLERLAAERTLEEMARCGAIAGATAAAGDLVHTGHEAISYQSQDLNPGWHSSMPLVVGSVYYDFRILAHLVGWVESLDLPDYGKPAAFSQVGFSGTGNTIRLYPFIPRSADNGGNGASSRPEAPGARRMAVAGLVGPRKAGDRPETAGEGHLGDADIGLAQQGARPFQALAPVIGARRGSEPPLEQALQLARGYADAARQLGGGNRLLDRALHQRHRL